MARRLQTAGSILTLTTVFAFSGIAPAQRTLDNLRAPNNCRCHPNRRKPGHGFTHVYSYDLDVAPGPGPFGSSDDGTYESYGPIRFLIVELGNECAYLSGAGTGVTVFNYAGPDEDAIDVRATGDAAAGKELFRLDLNLVRFFVADTQGTMFDDTAMPASPTFVDQADSHQSLVEFIGANNVRTQLNTGEEPYSLGRYDPLAIISGIQDEINESQASGALNAKLIAPLLQASALLDGRLDQKNIAKARGALEDFIKSVRTNRNKLDQVVADILSFTAQLVRGSIPRCGGS